MSYVLLARECFSYPRWYAMHSNELQIGSRVSQTGVGRWRVRAGASGIKTNARDTTSVTERRTSGTNGRTAPRGCKVEGDDDKRHERLGHNKKKMVEMEMAVFDVAKPHRRKLRTNERMAGWKTRWSSCNLVKLRKTHTYMRTHTSPMIEHVRREEGGWRRESKKKKIGMTSALEKARVVM